MHFHFQAGLMNARLPNCVLAMQLQVYSVCEKRFFAWFCLERAIRDTDEIFECGRFRLVAEGRIELPTYGL
jgi:hypothetical protein